MSGPAHCYVRDLSSYGAGLVLTRIHFGSTHLFYTPEESEELCLYLEIGDGEGEEGERVSLPVRPIWFKLDDSEDTRYFMMGVEFLAEPDDARIRQLKKAAIRNTASDQGWFSRFVDRMLG